MKLADALAPFRGTLSPAFLRAMTFVLEHETEFQAGHYGDYNFVRTEHDPKDPGGATRYGVDQNAHPGVNVGALTLGAALGMYHAGEWAAIRGDDLPADLALALFDSAVNVGAGRAVRWLQAGIGAKPDGNLGPATLLCVRQAGQEICLSAILDAREHYYRSEVRPDLRARFLKGWLARLADLRAALSKHSPLSSSATGAMHPLQTT